MNPCQEPLPPSRSNSQLRSRAPRGRVIEGMERLAIHLFALGLVGVVSMAGAETSPRVPTSQTVDGALVEEVARMAQVGGCRAPSFSPDGKRIAFISDLSGGPQVWMIDTEGGWPDRVTSFDDQVRGVQWSPTARPWRSRWPRGVG